MYSGWPDKSIFVTELYRTTNEPEIIKNYRRVMGVDSFCVLFAHGAIKVGLISSIWNTTALI